MASGDTLLALSALAAEMPSASYATFAKRGGRPCWQFDAAADESLNFTGVMPRNYAGGGITVTLVWAAASATSGTCRWSVAIERCTSQDLDSGGAATAQTAGGAANGTSGIPTYTDIAFTNGAQMDSVVAGDMFRITVMRDADGTSGTDDMTGDAELYAIEIRET
jgi:hypothetical protein